MPWDYKIFFISYKNNTKSIPTRQLFVKQDSEQTKPTLQMPLLAYPSLMSINKTTLAKSNLIQIENHSIGH